MNAIKLTYLTIGAAFLLASCENDAPQTEMPTESRQMHFRTSFPEIVSRGQIVSNDNLDEFHVTVFNPADSMDGKLSPYIDEEVVKMSDGSGVFSSENCMWPEPGKEKNALTFFAYYPAAYEGATIENATTISGAEPVFDYKLNFRVSDDISKQVDFITAYKSASMQSEMFSDIKLDFEHQLSRIEVNAKGESKSFKIEIAGIRIGGSYMKAAYDFKPIAGAGEWILHSEKAEKGNAEYIYSPQDKVVTIDKTASEVSIMGGTGECNYAMLIPAEYAGWNYENDNTNSDQGLYLGVLLRVIDTKGKQQYPYVDTNQGPNALDIPKVYLAVDGNGTVMSEQLYKGADGRYYTDPELNNQYNAPQGSQVKEFGWSTLPIPANWEPGYSYTYTLDYTLGVGLHAPDVEPSEGPNAGDPIISDKVGLTVSVKGWQSVSSSGITVPGS
ncbi:MAG: fimbrillin family protein [Muribaculaceae bacterium]|nr:fimbrillin family protein [Muribaculaceae bacterium]